MGRTAKGDVGEHDDQDTTTGGGTHINDGPRQNDKVNIDINVRGKVGEHNEPDTTAGGGTHIDDGPRQNDKVNISINVHDSSVDVVRDDCSGAEPSGDKKSKQDTSTTEPTTREERQVQITINIL